MGGILDKLDEWLRGLLIEGITGNLSGMFDTVNTKVGEIAGEVGQTPLYSVQALITSSLVGFLSN